MREKRRRGGKENSHISPHLFLVSLPFILLSAHLFLLHIFIFSFHCLLSFSFYVFPSTSFFLCLFLFLILSFSFPLNLIHFFISIYLLFWFFQNISPLLLSTLFILYLVIPYYPIPFPIDSIHNY